MIPLIKPGRRPADSRVDPKHLASRPSQSSSIWRRALRDVKRPWRTIFLLMLFASSVIFYPSDLDSQPRCVTDCDSPIVYLTEHYIRFIDTIVQFAMPLAMRDTVGLVQVAYVAISTTIATHGLKRLVNDWHVLGTRLGQRPWGNSSNHNMPSGHSSMASCATWFVVRRYGWAHGLYLLPILLLTMHARIALNQHTLSSVLVGTIIGFVMTYLFTSPYYRTDKGSSIRDRVINC